MPCEFGPWEMRKKTGKQAPKLRLRAIVKGVLPRGARGKATISK